MKRFLTSLAFFLSFTTANAQDPILTIPEFGKVDVAELQMKDCSFATEAPAANLLKYKEVELSVFPNGTTEVVVLTRYRIKIFNKKGYRKATITIPFYKDKAVKIKNIQAATYNLGENGQVVATPVEEADIFKEEGAKNDKKKSLKFAFPNVKEGSVVEYQFVTRYKLAYDVPSYYFQDDIPNVVAVYKISRPSSSTLKKRLIAALPIEETHVFDHSKGYDKEIVHDAYVMKNVPAFSEEPFMSSSHDYRYRMDFLVQSESLPSGFLWSAANFRLLQSRYFGAAFNARIPGTKEFIDSVKRLKTTPEKIRSVYSYVKRNIKWDHVYYKYANDLDEVWKEGEGTSAEINLSILNLLRKCDVQCYPVLYSTRFNGSVDYNFPDLSQFNTVNIAVVNGKKFNLLDGTSPYLSYETPPFNVVNRTGMLIDPVNNTRINIDFDRKLIWDSVFVSASIASDGLLTGTITKKYFDLAKSMKLQESESESGDDEDEAFAQTEVKPDTTWKLNVENELLPLVEHSTFHQELPATNQYYFLNPFLFADFSKNPFTDSTRVSDVDFGAGTASAVEIKIAVGKGIKLDDLPKSREIYGADSAIVFKYENRFDNDTITIRNSMEVRRPIFRKAEYSSLRKTFEQIYGLLNNQIVLVKKG